MGGKLRGVNALVIGLAAVTAIAIPAMAIPPTNVTVDYDPHGGLHVTAQHPTDRMERYYVRRMEVYKNDVMDKEVTFPRQSAAWGIDETVPYTAQPGDRIQVKLYSSEGGSGEGETRVPMPPADSNAAVTTRPPVTAPPLTGVPEAPH